MGGLRRFGDDGGGFLVQLLFRFLQFKASFAAVVVCEVLEVIL